jgi:hypothetical protein
MKSASSPTFLVSGYRRSRSAGSMVAKRKSIKRSDYNRVLVTDTLPNEAPIVFSNDGLYRNCSAAATAEPIMRTLLDTLVLTNGLQENKWRLPYSYKVRKTQIDFRRLAVIHPRSQWELRLLYEEYTEMILYLCSRSEFSIRQPYKVASRYYERKSDSAVNRYKEGVVALLREDPVTQYSPSFFAYKDFNRPHKFFDSMQFCDLEKQYKFLWRIDVAKCFESIYTHTLSWAIKDKEFSKQKKNIVDSTFGETFAKKMQNANNGETNGIVIGPEASRIFAEILFQAIDRRALINLRQLKSPLIHGRDYAVRRYVDDTFIFSNDQDDLRAVYEKYSEALELCNMRINSEKTERMSRPFATDKSRAIGLASRGVNEFIKSFCKQNKKSGKLTPTKIRYPASLTQSFIASCREMCPKNPAGYDEIASFLIGSLLERIKKIVDIQKAPLSEKSRGQYAQALRVLLDIMYFLYNMSPDVSSSYHMATAIILANRFARRHLGEHEPVIKQAIYDHTEQLLSSKNIREMGVKGFICLEAINVVLAASDLGKAHLLPEPEVRRLMQAGTSQGDSGGKYSYFGIVSCLFYIKDHDIYSSLRKEIVSDIKVHLSDLRDVSTNAEKALLLLDILACPHLEIQFKEKLVVRLHKDIGQPAPNQADLDAFFAKSDEQYWFVKWKGVDLLNMLQKRELRRAY